MRHCKDRADCAGSTRQHELDHTRSGIDLPLLADLRRSWEWASMICSRYEKDKLQDTSPVRLFFFFFSVGTPSLQAAFDRSIARARGYVCTVVFSLSTNS